MINHAIYSEEAGAFVSSKLQTLGAILHDYDPQLEIRWIPPRARTTEDSKPYCIVHNIPGKPPYTIFYFSDLDQPEDILARIWAGDNKQGHVLNKIEAQEQAIRAFHMKEWLERNEEAADKFHYLFTDRSPNYVNWVDDDGNKIRLDEERRRRPL